MFMSMNPVVTSKPAVNSNESPGRKKPMSSPHSANTITKMPTTAQAPRDSKQAAGSRASWGAGEVGGTRRA